LREVRDDAAEAGSRTALPDEDGVTLDYRGYDGLPVRTHFRFTSTGKISLTACAPIRAAA
jgi:hypothetical protein